MRRKQQNRRRLSPVYLREPINYKEVVIPIDRKIESYYLKDRNFLYRAKYKSIPPENLIMLKEDIIPITVEHGDWRTEDIMDFSDEF